MSLFAKGGAGNACGSDNVGKMLTLHDNSDQVSKTNFLRH